ncbi:MAG TPA: hypothetical protein VN841_00235 [Bryobacteraceae bacterium]|nr:hypothetical protein [Bryobacteraceae bacterium]
MFPTIDAALGMAFVYLLLSLVCSAVREAGESLAMRRSAALKAGLERLLGPRVAQELCQHPLVAALTNHPRGPAYIPSATFSAALLDMVRDKTNLPSHLQQALRALEAGCQHNPAPDALHLRAAIEAWFSAAMDSVSRAYKRHTHAWLAVIGLGVTIAMNADSIRMTSALLGHSALRAAVEQSGERIASGSFPTATEIPGVKQAAGELQSLGMPIGWSGQTRDNTLPWKEPWTGPWWNNARLLIQWHWAGWLFTVAAISLGAPFWFDLLKRVVPLRPARPE